MRVLLVAIALLAAAVTPSASGAIAQDVHASARLPNSVFQLPAPFEMRPACPVITVEPHGACPLPAIPAETWTMRATLGLCAESLCGSGFHAGDTIMLLAIKAGGSTFWRTQADRFGGFRSELPAPLCRFAPVTLKAFDTHAYRSNALSLGSAGC